MLYFYDEDDAAVKMMQQLFLWLRTHSHDVLEDRQPDLQQHTHTQSASSFNTRTYEEFYMRLNKSPKKETFGCHPVQASGFNARPIIIMTIMQQQKAANHKNKTRN